GCGSCRDGSGGHLLPIRSVIRNKSWSIYCSASAANVAAAEIAVKTRGLGGEQCQIKHCVLNATAKERLLALHVVALPKNPSYVFHSPIVKDAAEPADAAARFVVVRAKSKIRAAPLTRRGLFLLALYDSPEGSGCAL